MTENRFSTVSENVKRLLDEIAEEAVSSGRDPAEIRLMAVTKTQPPEQVNAAIAAGITLLGENRAQELLEKYGAYHKDGVEIHFIGHLQTNKARQIADKVGMIHSVDSLRLAEEIDRQCQRLGKAMDVLIEVNIGGELSKSGIEPEALGELAAGIRELPSLRLRGLMTVPPVSDDESAAEGYFLRMRQLYVDIRGKKMDNVPMDTLSMGMSGDYRAAVRQGATIIRLGSAIFGHRE